MIFYGPYRQLFENDSYYLMSLSPLQFIMSANLNNTDEESEYHMIQKEMEREVYQQHVLAERIISKRISQSHEPAPNTSNSTGIFAFYDLIIS